MIGRRVSRDELDVLWSRLKRRSNLRFESGTASVGEVAEATGLSEAEVQEHLRAIRAEMAFDRPVASIHPLLALGALALLCGLYAYQKRGGSISIGSWSPRLFAASPPGRPSMSRPLNWPSSISGGTVHQAGRCVPPSGFRIEVAGATAMHVGDGAFQCVPMPYGTMHDRIADAVVSLAKAEQMDEARSGQNGAQMHYSSFGMSFMGRRKAVHVGIDSWATPVFAWIDLPIDGRFRQQASRLATQALPMSSSNKTRRSVST